MEHLVRCGEYGDFGPGCGFGRDCGRCSAFAAQRSAKLDGDARFRRDAWRGDSGCCRLSPHRSWSGATGASVPDAKLLAGGGTERSSSAAAPGIGIVVGTTGGHCRVAERLITRSGGTGYGSGPSPSVDAFPADVAWGLSVYFLRKAPPNGPAGRLGEGRVCWIGWDRARWSLGLLGNLLATDKLR